MPVRPTCPMQIAVVMVLYITTSLDECQGSSLKILGEDRSRLPLRLPVPRDRCARTSSQMQQDARGFVAEVQREEEARTVRGDGP